MSTDARSPRDLAARLIARAEDRDSARGAVGAATAAFERMSAQLCVWVGAGGCHALLTRALRRAQADHPSLSRSGIISGSPPRLDGLADRAETADDSEMAAGLEATLVALFELLARVIGEDLSVRLAELSMRDDAPDGSRPTEEGAP